MTPDRPKHTEKRSTLESVELAKSSRALFIASTHICDSLVTDWGILSGNHYIAEDLHFIKGQISKSALEIRLKNVDDSIKSKTQAGEFEGFTITLSRLGMISGNTALVSFQNGLAYKNMPYEQHPRISVIPNRESSIVYEIIERTTVRRKNKDTSVAQVVIRHYPKSKRFLMSKLVFEGKMYNPGGVEINTADYRYSQLANSYHKHLINVANMYSLKES